MRLVVNELHDVRVANLAEAVIKHDEARDASNLLAAAWAQNDPRVIGNDGKVVARFSYDGRLWNPDDATEELIIDRSGRITGSQRA